MDLLLSLLRYSKKHGETIIVVLLALLAFGGVAGALWIGELRESIATLEKQLVASQRLLEERKDLEAQRFLNATNSAEIGQRQLESKLKELARPNDRLKAYTERVDTLVNRHLSADRALLADLSPEGTGNTAADMVPRDGAVPFSRERAAAALRTSIDTTTSELAVVKDWVIWISDTTTKSNDAKSIRPTIAYSRVEHSSGWFLWAVYVAAFIGFATILVWLGEFILRGLGWGVARLRRLHGRTEK